MSDEIITLNRHYNKTILKPDKDSPKSMDTPLAVQRALPGVTILVHGVNDVGEAYPAQEAGLCQGWNERLNRKDLTPGEYPPVNPNQVLDDPDAVLYQRASNTDLESRNRSPVIPFYWGFREVEGKINNKTQHAQKTDRSGNRLDRRGIKQGGPFANATTNIPDMWGPGFTTDSANRVSTPTHPLFEGPPRLYMVLAAKRLALLIQTVRLRYKHDVVNLICHSQGTIIALLAQAYLHKWGARPADCLVMNNSPYSLAEPAAEFVTEAGYRQQTTHARLATLINLINHIWTQKYAEPAFAKLSDVRVSNGLCGLDWGDKKRCPDTGQKIAYTDRDNRGRVYLYFSPEDSTVGLTNVRGIGWQGVPDTLNQKPCLAALGAGFKQRIFTERVRQNLSAAEIERLRQKGNHIGAGEALKVGAAANIKYVLRQSGEDDWPNKGMGEAKQAGIPTGDARTITGEALTPPCAVNLHCGEAQGKTGQLPVGPLDAAVAVTNKGINAHWENIPDPRPINERYYHPKSGKWVLPDNERQKLQDKFNAGLTPGDSREIISAVAKSNGTLDIKRSESPNQARRRWQNTSEDNSYHSAIVANPEHSRRVTAYDTALGWADAADQRAFFAFLCLIADWRKDLDIYAFPNFTKTTICKSAYFATLTAEHQQLIRDTWKYAREGILPKLEACSEFPLIVSEAQLNRDLPPSPDWQNQS